jgi:osmoprotectant transport system substrate-binding protein
MSSRWVRGVAAAAATLGVAAGVAACGGGGDGGAVKAAANGPLAGTTLKVGSKDFAEQFILGNITMDVLKANGAKVVDKTDIVGSDNTRKALLGGDIDLYWDYTGTGWITYLKNTRPIPDPAAQFKAVQKADLRRNKIVWSDPAPLNNTYALAAKSDTAKQLGVSSLSDVAALAQRDPGKVTICVESEFKGRDDGLPGLLRAYGINIPRGNIKTLDTGLIYTSTANGKDCTFGEVFTTDGRIKALNLTVLRDDRHFFPVYQASLTLRSETARAHPEIQKLLAPVAAKLTDDVMRDLNSRVDVDGEKPAKVAEDWLKQQGFLK